MKLFDRLRVEYAIIRYDFWLELRGVRGPRRRDLRRELRANLAEASADVGTTRALFGIGSPQQLAYAAQPADPSRPRWSLGLLCATGVFVLVFWGLLATLLTILQTVEAAHVTEAVEVRTFPWFGTTFTAQHTPGTIDAGFEFPWALLVLPLLTLLLVAQPWRQLRRPQPLPVVD
ncbi:hypothetical protein ACOCJ7_09035 [Knoellia sp. CPCC 206453]|uniref:hypothetical protein n=1 Tax=Knoellia pratensis TaxID=3404796 RepID=UPI0036176E26